MRKTYHTPIATLVALNMEHTLATSGETDGSTYHPNPAAGESYSLGSTENDWEEHI